MTHEEWWDEVGSGIPPMPGEDAHEHTKRVIAACWPAARATIYEAEAAQLTDPLRAKIEALTKLLQEGEQGFGRVLIATSDDAEVGSEIERLREGHARYEIARRMNPQQWAAAWKLNLSTGKPFDEIIDDMRPFMTPNA